MREYRDVLQKMAVGIVEKHRRSWHPGKDDRLIRRSTIEIERRNAGGTERVRSCQHVGEADTECGVRRHLLRCGPRAPESKHPVAGRTNPEERGLACPFDVAEAKTNHVTVETDRFVQIGYSQVDFKQAIN